MEWNPGCVVRVQDMNFDLFGRIHHSVIIEKYTKFSLLRTYQEVAMTTPVTTPQKKSHKNFPAIVAAFGVTLVMGLIIVAVGFNSLVNQNTTPVQAAPNDTGVTTAGNDQQTADAATIQQLQDLVQQYQSRESQYQTELKQAADQLNTVNTQLQQYQMLVNALQQAGVIQVNSNGQVFINRGGARGGDDN